MHFLVRATIPVEVGNTMIHDPNMGKKIEDVMGDLKPEAVYFCVDKGQRTIYFLINPQDSSELPGICEPLWNAFKADNEFIPAMAQEDFAKAGPIIERVSKKY